MRLWEKRTEIENEVMEMYIDLHRRSELITFMRLMGEKNRNYTSAPLGPRNFSKKFKTFPPVL